MKFVFNVFQKWQRCHMFFAQKSSLLSLKYLHPKIHFALKRFGESLSYKLLLVRITHIPQYHLITNHIFRQKKALVSALLTGVHSKNSNPFTTLTPAPCHLYWCAISIYLFYHHTIIGLLLIPHPSEEVNSGISTCQKKIENHASCILMCGLTSSQRVTHTW